MFPSIVSPLLHFLHGQTFWGMEKRWGWGASLINPSRELAQSGLGEDLRVPRSHKQSFPFTRWGVTQAEKQKLWMWIQILMPALICRGNLGQASNLPEASNYLICKMELWRIKCQNIGHTKGAGTGRDQWGWPVVNIVSWLTWKIVIINNIVTIL